MLCVPLRAGHSAHQLLDPCAAHQDGSVRSNVRVRRANRVRGARDARARRAPAQQLDALPRDGRAAQAGAQAHHQHASGRHTPLSPHRTAAGLRHFIGLLLRHDATN